MHKNATKCNKTQSKWCINKHGASKIIDTFETYQVPNWAASTAIKEFFWRRYWGERGFLQGESLASNLFTLLLFCLFSLLYFCLHLFIKNTKK
jgi:hypothetical protein